MRSTPDDGYPVRSKQIRNALGDVPIMKQDNRKRPGCGTHNQEGQYRFRWNPSCSFNLPVTYLLRGLNHFLPDRDTVTEVLIVLGIVTVIYFFSWADNLQGVAQQMSPSVSEASPATIQK
jgi:hypothetical protein